MGGGVHECVQVLGDTKGLATGTGPGCETRTRTMSPAKADLIAVVPLELVYTGKDKVVWVAASKKRRAYSPLPERPFMVKRDSNALKAPGRRCEESECRGGAETQRVSRRWPLLIGIAPDHPSQAQQAGEHAQRATHTPAL